MWWMGLIQAGVGIAQTAIAASQKTPSMQKYSMTPENKLAGQMALRTAQQGASGAQRAQFDMRLARQGTATKQMFQNAGLNGSTAANIMSIDALNQFAAQDSDTKLKGEAAYTNWAQIGQGLANKNVEGSNAYANEIAKGQGETLKAGIGNIIGGANAASNAALTNKSIDMYGKIAANANNDLGVGGGGGGGGVSQSPYANNPSPAWTSQQPFMLQNQYLPQQGSYQAPGTVDPSLLGTPSFGSAGFGAAVSGPLAQPQPTQSGQGFYQNLQGAPGQIPPGANNQYGQFMPQNQPFGSPGLGATPNWSQLWGG
jgi:hypothetical protein